MISALFYLQTRSFWNGLVTRVKRLRQPKYLAGAIVGLAWFLWTIGGPILMQSVGNRHRAGGRPLPEGLPPLGAGAHELMEGIAAAGLAVWVLMAWIIPGSRAALQFTEAEVSFLFPAPISRRGLIHYKLLRWQLGLILTSLIFTLVTGRFARDGTWLIHVAGWWLGLFTMNLHSLAASFTLTHLVDAGLSNWKRRTLIGLMAAVVIGLVGAWAWRNLPEFTADEDWITRGKAVLQSPPGYWLLLPFRLVVRPWFANSAGEFLLAAGPVLLLLALHYLWVIRSEVSFEEASVDLARRRAEVIANARSGNWQAAQRPKKPQRAPFRLTAHGFPPVALLWKNLISAGAVLTGRSGILLLVWIVIMGVAFGNTGKQGILGVLLALCGMGLIMLTVMGSQFFRYDLRQDLTAVEVLKQFPLPGWQVVLGELMAPAVMLTVIQWMLVTLMVVISSGLGETAPLPMGVRISIALCIGILAPAYNLVALLVPNAATLLFPAWFQAGKEGPAGFEVMGQRLLFTFGTLFALVFALLPAALVFAATLFVLQFTLPVWVTAPFAALAAAAALAVEGAAGLWWLGRLFERFDVTNS